MTRQAKTCPEHKNGCIIVIGCPTCKKDWARYMTSMVSKLCDGSKFSDDYFNKSSDIFFGEDK